MEKKSTEPIILHLSMYNSYNLDTISQVDILLQTEGKVLLDTISHSASTEITLNDHSGKKELQLILTKEGYGSDTTILLIGENKTINKQIYLVPVVIEATFSFFDHATKEPVNNVNLKVKKNGQEMINVLRYDHIVTIELEQEGIYHIKVSKDGYISDSMEINILPTDNFFSQNIYLKRIDLSMDLSYFEDIGLLSFNIPPPATEKIISVKELQQLMPESKLLGDVDSVMVSRLEAAGYKGKYDYFKIVKDREIRPGIVYVTDFERIDEEGNITSDRWNYKVEKSESRNWLGIKKVGKGYFRFFAFVLYEGSFGTTDFDRERDSFNEVFSRYMEGASTGFPDQLREVEYDDDLNLYILIYEYFQMSNEEDGKYKALDITPEAHLRSAGLSYFIDQ